MASVNVFTAARMQEIEDTTVVSGLVDVNGDLILYDRVGTPQNAGSVIGPQPDLASSAETISGTLTNKAVSPAGLASLTATESRKGIVELATTAEVQTGTATDIAVTPAGLASRTASQTRTGLVEHATDAEAYAGADGVRVVTPSNLGSMGLKDNGRLSKYSNVSGGDWNSYTESGFYAGSTMSNAPVGATFGWHLVEVVAHGGTWVHQRAIDLHNHRRRWVRSNYGGTWSAWTPDFLQQTISNQFIGGAFNSGIGNSGLVWWGELTVSFGTTFASIPNVNIYCESTGAVMYAVILSISTTSFTFRAVRLQAALGTGFSYRWAATGPLA